MYSARWQRVWDVFHAVAEEPRAERGAALAGLCGDDSELRLEVESLLESFDKPTDFLDRPELLAVDHEDSTEPGQHFGPYEVLRELGEGGMGVVYLARRADEEFDRTVAIKLLRGGFDGEEAERRFRLERQILAGLDHPHIAKLLDGGSTADRRPYLVLERIEGVPIDEYCRRNELGLGQRLRLFCKVCDAAEYAHRHLVVHRDLKPGNILVTEGGNPKLLDFGIAKLLSEDPRTTHTRIMTPGYASPEQIRGEPIHTGSDVYSLGVLLYELLVGRSPYRAQTDEPFELAREILEEEPVLPSVAVRRGHARHDDGSGVDDSGPLAGLAPGRLRQRLEGDLDNIVLKALHKDPRRRYHSAEQLSEDLRRHLGGHPVTARPDTLVYRVSKFIGRHPVAVTASAVAVLLLLATTTFAVLQTQQAGQALEEASQQRVTAESATSFLQQTLLAADPARGLQRRFTTQELLDRGARLAILELGDQPAVRARVQASLGMVYFDLELFEEAEEQYIQALEAGRELFDPGHPTVVTILNHLGALRVEQGQYGEAESYLLQALDLLSNRAPEDLWVGVVRESLGALEVRRGDYDRAEAHLVEAIRIFEQASPDSLLARALIRLGALERARGDYAESELLLLRGHDIRNRELRPGHPWLLDAKRNLGDLYLESGQLREAEEQYREALAGLRKEELDVKQVLNGLASVLRKSGNLTEAEQHYREALHLYRDQFGEDNARVTTPMVNLALVLQEQGDLETAEPLARQVIAINSKHYGEDHPTLIAPLNNLGLLLQEKGSLAQAEELFDRAEDLARRRLGDRHPAVAFLLNNRADLEHESGDLPAAEELYRSALELRREVLPDEHPDLAASLGGLGQLLVETGRASEAETLLRQALDIRLSHLSEDDWHVADARAALGACLLALDQSAEGLPLLERGHAGLLAAKGADDRRTTRARTWLERFRGAAGVTASRG